MAKEMMKIVAIVGERKTGILEIEKPEPQENEILVKIIGCGICTWEQRVFTQVSKMKLPFHGGHEVVGTIEKLGSNVSADEYPIGKRVVARTMFSCGECYYCRHGQENLCVKKGKKFKSETILPAGMGQYISLHVSQIYMIPDDVSVDKAVLTEPLACVVNSIEKGQIRLGDDVVVIGGGVMGQLHVLCAKASGARVILSEPDERRAQLAKELGADITINPLSVDPVEEVKKITGRGAEVVFNTTAIAAVAKQAVEMTAPLGQCVMYSSIHPDKPIEINPNWLHNTQVNITGAVSPSVESFATAVSLIGKGIIDPHRLLSGKYDYTRADEAFEAALKLDTYRIMLTF